MADDLYDADCDVARFLESPGRDSYLLDFNEPPEAAVAPGVWEIHQHVPANDVQPAPSAILDFPQPTIDDAGQQQAPAAGVENHPAPAFGYLPHMVNVAGHVVPAFGYQALLLGDDFEHRPAFDFEAPSHGDEPHQARVFGFQHAPSMNNVEHDQASASSGFQFQVPLPAHQEAPAVSAAQHHQALVMDDVEHHEMLAEPASNILPSPPRSPREDVPPVGDGLAYVPFVEGQLDCTVCRTVREVLHETGNYPGNAHTLMICYPLLKLIDLSCFLRTCADRHRVQFIVHAGNQGAFQHAILRRMEVRADGRFQIKEPLVVE
jgi:hypothetical protein